MTTKDAILVISSTIDDSLKNEDFVEYICYNNDRTTDRALGQVKYIQNDSAFLSNGNIYPKKSLIKMKLFVVCDRDPLENEKGIFVDTPYCYGLKKIIAKESEIGFSKDVRHGDDMCHLCVPVLPIELNEIMNNKGKCKIETKIIEGKEVVKFVNGKITFILN
jgi:hypothetical protein